MHFTLILFKLFTLFNTIFGFIGYDCGSRSTNITTLSLLDVADCEIPQETVNVTNKYIQLLQINEYSEVEVIQCKLELRRTIYRCGMFSHVSIVHNGENEYIYDISEQACKDVHLTGTLKFSNDHIINGIRINNTVTHSLTIAGQVTSEGACTGASYSDPYGNWNSVVVQGLLKITLTKHIARISLNNNLIHLESGTSCPLSDGTCLDSKGGYTFWKTIPEDNCKFNQYSVLFEGYASKMTDFEFDNKQTVYSLSTKEVTFALTEKSKESVCGYTVIRTEHPKLIIFETTKEESFAKTKQISVSNLDIFAYVNSKFVYVEKHIRKQMKQLYRDVILQKCNLERQTLQNTLTIATQAPDEFAYQLMKGPGYMAVVAGEVVHVIKCVPVEVKIQHGTDCYAELQVSHENSTYFITPRTHILKSKGTRIACNAILPPYYRVGETWYRILPRPVSGAAPLILHPTTKPTWRYVNPSDLATSGIYTDKDLEELKERIMFPVEKPSLLNNLAREMHGHIEDGEEGTSEINERKHTRPNCSQHLE